MKNLSSKSRNGFGRPLRFESLETRRLLSADLSVGVADAARLVHHESSHAAEVGHADPGRESHAKSGGKHVELSSIDRVSLTHSLKVKTPLAVKPLPLPTVSVASSATVRRHDDSVGSGDSWKGVEKGHIRGKDVGDISNDHSADPSSTGTSDDQGRPDTGHSGTESKDKHPETEVESGKSDDSSVN